MKIALLGDIAFFGNLSSINNLEIESYFADISTLLGSYDYVVGNLETPFSHKKKAYGSKSAYICADPIDVRLLNILHVKAVSLANNHMFDYGKEGYELTKKTLLNNRIDYFGSEGKQLYVDINDNKLAFSGFCCYSTNPLLAVTPGRYGVNELNPLYVERMIKKNHEDGFLNIVSVHAGLEHVNYPSLDTIRLARRWANVCPYVYYGHHPHVVQGIEYFRESLIAYSLGNFCFDDVKQLNSDETLVELSENNRSSFVLELSIENNRVLGYKVIPIYIGKNKLELVPHNGDNIVELYTNPIKELSPAEYINKRNTLLEAYFLSRKRKRDLKWYLKRMKYRYMRLLINAVWNRRKYNSLIVKYINN